MVGRVHLCLITFCLAYVVTPSHCHIFTYHAFTTSHPHTPPSLPHRYTQNTATNSIYAIFLKWPADYNLQLQSIRPSASTTLTLLGYSGTLSWVDVTPNILVPLPYLPLDSSLQWGWTLKFQTPS